MAETCGSQTVIFTNDVASALAGALGKMCPNGVFVLADSHTKSMAEELLAECRQFGTAEVVEIPSGDGNKNLRSLQLVWDALQEGGATRSSALVNVGGGVVTDLGGFAAATFKRGIRFVNVPTSLLAAVDAAVGGKTGINYHGLKNEIGAFCEADAVIISTRFFGTLPPEEVKSGYAEMLKHGLISGGDDYSRLLEFNFESVDGEELLCLLEKSVGVKRRIVEQDPTERGLRKALNLGHTVGHAFESMAMERGKPVPHGYAVAWGLVAETVLSKLLKGLNSSVLYGLADYVRVHYGAFAVTCDDYPRLLGYMRHDKKSLSGEYNFSLLQSPGNVVVGCVAEEDDVKAALDIYRDLMHI